MRARCENSGDGANKRDSCMTVFDASGRGADMRGSELVENDGGA